jgi:hypothetical protein
MAKVTKKGLMNDLSIKRCIFFIRINQYSLPDTGTFIAPYNGAPMLYDTKIGIKILFRRLKR